MSQSLRMPRQELVNRRIPKTIAAVEDVYEVMLQHLNDGNGIKSEVEKRLARLSDLRKALYDLQQTGIQKSQKVKIKKVYLCCIKPAIVSSIIKGGSGYPSLTGALLDFVTDCCPGYAKECYEDIGLRGFTQSEVRYRYPRQVQRKTRKCRVKPHREEVTPMKQQAALF